MTDEIHFHQKTNKNFKKMWGVLYLEYLYLPFCHFTNGGGVPEAWHSRLASSPATTITTCCATEMLGGSEKTTSKKGIKTNIV